MQDYTCLRVAVMICATLVNKHTQRDSFSPTTLLSEPAV